MTHSIKKELLSYFFTYLTQNKKSKMEEIISHRTRYVSVVLEDSFQSHNTSAVIRSAECLGVQDIYIVEDQNPFSLMTGITRGAEKWINLFKYKNTESCFKELREKGYKIIATTPHKKSYLLSELPIDHKFALVFGNEALGLSKNAMSMADECVSIPMYGFTESFNISVSVALCLHNIIERLRRSSLNWDLSEDEILDICLMWARKSIKGSELLEKKFIEGWSKN